MSLESLPLVIIPGIQGRWEWMRPAIDALRQEHEVSSFSLNEEDGTGDPFEQWIGMIHDRVERSGSDRVVLIGVSFGGLVAVRYAARHPERVAALILVSTPSPGYRLSELDEGMVRNPIAKLPRFAMRGVRRLAPEIVAAKDTWRERLAFSASVGFQVVFKPAAPRQMARWVRAWQASDIASECARITAPTHLITGEPRLDRVVPVQSTLHYLTLIPGATFSRLARTGHIGLVSRPQDFSTLVNEFLHATDDPGARRSA
ncbi:MAG TPA: alpha/beta hydrolase [Vicinamibacterales bacterium]|nr:alpha/beta hydrolase [Vicinamibacterales bacterium]